MPETVVDEPGIADSPIASIDPKDAARAMAVEAAEDENGVGEFVEAIDAGDGITDYRFVSLMRGYEGWQWSVTMFHDVERDTWTVNESTLIPVEQALRHPQWEMGAKITIDSSTLVNKGFEVIEAHWLFGTPVEKITVLLHPQSIVHSMVEFEDGAIKAQLGTPDMRMPISFALMYPRRATRPGERFDFMAHPQLTFAGVDRAKYPALEIACECLRRRGTAACTMNGANEVAVAAFLGRKCAWLDIVRAIEYALGRASFAAAPTLGDYAEANDEARRLAAEYLAL